MPSLGSLFLRGRNPENRKWMFYQYLQNFVLSKRARKDRNFYFLSSEDNQGVSALSTVCI